MTAENTLLSIVIATKNREQYCIQTLQSVLSQADLRLQLVIADNSATPAVQKFVAGLHDSRLVYEYDPTPKSSIDNFNRAVELSTGEFVCLLGDDDTILANMLPLVDWMRENEIDSLSSDKMIDYVWPNPGLKGKENGVVYIPVNKQLRRQVPVKEALDRLLRHGIVNYAGYSLPRVYHGVIRRSCMNELKQRTGHFFGALSPDIYSTMNLSTIVRNHYVVSFPFTIAGACPASTSVASLNAGHSGNLKDAPHFVNRKEPYQWENVIPSFYCVETIWAESGLKALGEIGRNDLIEKFDLYKLMPYIVLSNLKYIRVQHISKTWTLIVHSLRECLKVQPYSGKSYAGHALWLFGGLLSTAMSLFGKQLMKKMGRNNAEEERTVQYGVADLREALALVDQKLKIATLADAGVPE